MRGKAGVTRYEVDNLGRVIGKAKSNAAQSGSNLVTSIDSRVQRVAEYELDTAMKTARQQFDKITGENYKADSGAVVVMEAKTGRIVSMASAPTYDPNAWVGGISAKDYKALTGKNSDYPLLNRAMQGQSAPGSTFKVVSTAAAVEAGYGAGDGGYPCTSSYSVGGQVFKNFEGENFGPISLGRALEVSCDTVFYGLADDSEGRRHQPQEGGAEGLLLQGRPPVRPRQGDRRRPAQRGHRPRPDRQWKQNYWKANKDVWCKSGKKDGDYVQKIAYENCLEGNKMREGDEINYSIGQGDTLVTPIQEAMEYPGHSPTAAPSTRRPSARRSSAPTARPSRRSSPRSRAGCRSARPRSRAWTRPWKASSPVVPPPGSSAAGRRTRSRCTPRPVLPRSTASRPRPGSPRTPRTTRSS